MNRFFCVVTLGLSSLIFVCCGDGGDKKKSTKNKKLLDGSCPAEVVAWTSQVERDLEVSESLLKIDDPKPVEDSIAKLFANIEDGISKLEDKQYYGKYMGCVLEKVEDEDPKVFNQDYLSRLSEKRDLLLEANKEI